VLAGLPLDRAVPAEFVHAFTLDFFKLHFNIIIPPISNVPSDLPLRSYNQNLYFSTPFALFNLAMLFITVKANNSRIVNHAQI
jgi:hypothetical protein